MNVGIIGTGFVGSATAFALIMRGVARKIVLIDQNKAKAEAEAHDIAHATPFAYANKIKAGDYPDLKGCDVVIITAGANQKPGQTRTDLLGTNVKIFEGIVPQIAKYAPECIILVASNPVDVMTEVALKLSGFPTNRVLGSGTTLDTARFKTLLGYHLGISPKSIHANVLGEHGDSEVLVWSNADAGTVQLDALAKELGKPLTNKVKAQIDDDVRNAAYKIIEGKGATFYGIAGALTRICQAIGSNEYAILTVSSHHKEFCGICDTNDICLSFPTVIGKRGIHKIIFPHLNEDEKEKIRKSAKTIKENSETAAGFING
ncbi:MAG: L-lactate dehydrogenase [Lactobacillus sp.]|jgi:L-lactate dehydrogenase|nr:L-lactate dehydrogenase [Lactobacillus sp.]